MIWSAGSIYVVSTDGDVPLIWVFFFSVIWYMYGSIILVQCTCMTPNFYEIVLDLHYPDLPVTLMVVLDLPVTLIVVLYFQLLSSVYFYNKLYGFISIYRVMSKCMSRCVHKQRKEQCDVITLGTCMGLVCLSLTSLCHSDGHIETMPAREINPFTALTRIRSQFLRTQWSTSNHQRVDMTTPHTAQPSGLVALAWVFN